MNGIDNPIIFYPSALLMILLALFAIGLKDIFRSLICAIGVFFLAGLFFYILGSEYNAVIQIAIYGVAVPVILGLAIMFTNHKGVNKGMNEGANKRKDKSSNLKYVVFLISGLFILSIVYLALTSLAITPNSFSLSEQIGGTTIQTISAITNGIFVKYVYAFEIFSIILTLIVVGLTFVNKTEKEEVKDE